MTYYVTTRFSITSTSYPDKVSGDTSTIDESRLTNCKSLSESPQTSTT